MKRHGWCRIFGVAALAWTLGPAAVLAAEGSPAWAALTPAQQQALAPLQRDWSTLDEQRRRMWLEVASRFTAMPAAERARVQERMAEWARMSPAERRRARLQFNEARQLSDEERKAKWRAYQSLPEDERRKLARRAGPEPAAGSTDPKPRPGAGQRPRTTERAAEVAPARQLAKPGATTTPLSKQPNPPPHHRAGLPKIAVTPGFVDPATLLPQRGPQGAAVQPQDKDRPRPSRPERAPAKP